MILLGIKFNVIAKRARAIIANNEQKHCCSINYAWSADILTKRKPG